MTRPTEETRELITKALMRTRRKGMKQLVRRMDEIGYFTAPCSGGNHLCEEGGLAEHSLNVYETAMAMAKNLMTPLTKEMRQSITIATLLHDLGKCGDYDKPMYVSNILKSGKASATKPYKRNTELSAVPHAVRSIKLATLFIDLTEDEEWAILTHDGLYDFMKYEIPNHETWLSLLVHYADLWSSKIIEATENKEEE